MRRVYVSNCSLGLGCCFEAGDNIAGLLFKVDESTLEVAIVDHGGTLSRGVEHENQSEHLEHVVEGDKVEDESRKVVEDLEASKHNPVGEPLLLHLFIAGIEGQERLESGVCNSQQAGNV